MQSNKEFAPYNAGPVTKGTSGSTGAEYGSSSTGAEYGSSRTESTGSSSYAPGVEQRLNEMGSGAERVVTNQTISEGQARKPTEEYTEYIDKPKVQQPDQYVTQQHVMEQQEAPIRLKQQEVQEVHQKTVVQEQPVIIKKQEVQVSKEHPIEVNRNTTEHQTLPPIEKKELYIQPVESSGMQDRTVSHTATQADMPVDYSRTQGTYNQSTVSGESHKHGTLEHIKEKVGGALESAREKTREMFHGSSNERTVTKETTPS